MMKKIFPFFLALISLLPQITIAQGTDCTTATPFCTDAGAVTFPAQQNTTAPLGPNYACLGSQPNPAWFYLQIGTAGNTILTMSASEDIDFICWGPFPSPSAGCSSGLTGAPVDCSYSPNPTETATINSTLVGQVYILLITNYSNNPTIISLEQTGGTGATDCGIVCSMSALTVVPDTCASTDTLFNVSGTVTYVNPPATGTLTISNSCSSATQVINSPFNPTSANYTLTGLPANGATCTVTAMFSANPTCKLTQNFTAPLPVSLSFSAVTNLICFGSSSGSATVNALNGIAPYAYSWSPGGQTTQIATGLSAGTYTVMVTATGGCVAIDSVTIANFPQVLDSVTSITNIDCFGNNTGSASDSVLSGSPPYTYLWNPGGQTTSTATGLSEGTYTLTITDSVGCTLIDSVIITSPLALSHTITPVTNVTCFGFGDGTATINVSGGTPIYTYSWSNSQTSQNAIGLDTGTYTIVVTDLHLCSFTDSVTITSPLPLTHSFSGIANVDCFGNPTGAATVNVSGGTIPYSYSWNSIPVQTTLTADTLYAGTFTVTVLDSNGCSFADSVVITTPTGLGLFSPTISDVYCYGDSTGFATVTAFGGTPGYGYLWTPTSQTSSTATGLALGVYTVVITDTLGCLISTLVQITEPDSLIATSSHINILCSGDGSGTAAISVSGGSFPYTYLWNPNVGTTATISGLPAGSYSVLVTDSLGCSLSSSFILTQPAAPLSVVSSFVDVLCNPDSTGSAAVVVAGGSPAYSYLWNTGQTDSTISNLPAGIYSVMITDTSGCLDSASFTIAQPLLLSFTASQTNILCFGNSTGIASVMVTGGTLPYTYVWNTFATDTSTITGLPAGIDSVLITDAHGCALDTSFIISQPALPLSISSSFVTVLCNPDSTGSATILVTGGTPTYYYLWSSGQTTASISNLPAGNYSLIVTDTNGCRDSVFIPITQPPLFTASISPDTIICNGTSLTESIITNGGAPAYTYLWMPGGITDSTFTISPVANISYTVQVSDANGCSSSPLNTAITVFPMPVANISVSPSTAVFFPQTICFRADSTNINTWLWNFGDNTTDSGYAACHDFPKGGKYCVTLIVTNNICIDTAETCVVEVDVVMPNVFSPNDDGVNDTFFAMLDAGGITYFSCEIYDRWGLKMAELVRPKQGWEGYTTSGSPAAAGTYYYVLSVSWGNEMSVHKKGFLTLVR